MTSLVRTAHSPFARLTRALSFFVLLLLSAFYHPAKAAEAEQQALKLPNLKQQPCRIEGFASLVQCGQITRPLNPDAPNGTQITVHFIVLPALDKNKAPAPIFLLAGGPGQSAISVASYLKGAFEKLQRRHDLVFVDQRGTGKSAPLACNEETEDDFAGLGQRDFQIQQALLCQQKLKKLPYGDLRFFTTTLAMQDLDAVRQALRIEQINLIGVSYGTRAALEYARQFAPHLKRSILDGVVQADTFLNDGDLQLSLQKLFTDCNADARCHAAYPTLQNEWQKLLNSLPQTAQLTHPRLGNTFKATINREDVLGAVMTALYAPTSSAGLPFAIHQATLGNFNALLALSGAGNLPNAGKIYSGMHFSVICSEEYDNLIAPQKPINNENTHNDFGDMHRQNYIAICKNWQRGSVPKAFHQIAPATSPVLLLSGGLDPVTPPQHAEQVATMLGNKARQIVVNNSGHGVLQQPCLTDVAALFINAKTDEQALNISVECVKQIPRPSVWIAPKAAQHGEAKQ